MASTHLFQIVIDQIMDARPGEPLMVGDGDRNIWIDDRFVSIFKSVPHDPEFRSLQLIIRHISAIDGEHTAGRVRRAIGQKPADHLGHLIGCCQALERNLAQDEVATDPPPSSGPV